MKTYKILITLLVVLAFSCKSSHDHDDASEATINEESHSNTEIVHLSQQQFDALDMHIDTLALRKMDVVVETNGELEVPPQNEASVTAIVGANVDKIMVIEGDKIAKGQVLAYLSHPNLIKIQTDYISEWNKLQYLENEYQRQETLYAQKVGSGKDFQKIKSEYLATKGMAKGYEAQLKQMGLNIEKLRNGDIYESVPVLSPISGNVRLVEVKTGQYVQPETEIFSLVNIDHIHADFMVYEKDIRKVKKGQEIHFSVESEPDREFSAVIYSVGKAFEQNPKAVHIHAEIEEKNAYLLPGMYVRGKIFSESKSVSALPDEAITNEADGSFIFTVEPDSSHGEMEWNFRRVEIRTGRKFDGWTEVKLLQPLKKGIKIAWNNAYYLEAELKKGEAEHSH